MINIGIYVPYGLVITIDFYHKYLANNYSIAFFIRYKILKSLLILKNLAKKSLENMIISIRSGSSFSMPGMMYSILNFGFNNNSIYGSRKYFIFNSYLRYLEIYTNLVIKINKIFFIDIFTEVKNNIFISSKRLFLIIIKKYRKSIYKVSKKIICRKISTQLFNSVISIFSSLNNINTLRYMNINKIPKNIGTAISIQLMIFGNRNFNSLTGVAFSRNPSTGNNKIFIEYSNNSQGDDVVSGIKNPEQISNSYSMIKNIYLINELIYILKKLENHYRDIQDVEFTIENNNLWILQTRKAKRSSVAIINSSVKMLEQKLLTKKELFNRINLTNISHIIYPTIVDSNFKKTLLLKAIPSSPGCVSGRIVFSFISVIKYSKLSKTILIKSETNTDDVKIICKVNGVITLNGGTTSHAAIITRSMGKPCITGAKSFFISNKYNTLIVKKYSLKEGDYITINGSSGEIFAGRLSIQKRVITRELQKILFISTKYNNSLVMLNSEYYKDISIAKKFYVHSIGLCRTEHMFIKKNRIFIFRNMILSLFKNKKFLTKILLFQIKDFFNLFKFSNKHVFSIRLLDPPIHEFLDKKDNKFAKHQEHNPMLGHRGVRIAITNSIIYKVQIKAVFIAIYKCVKQGLIILPKIIIPFIINILELRIVKNIVIEIFNEVQKKLNIKITYKIGSMIELPIAIINLEEIAKELDFVSFGTNDLTQTLLGISRDDISNFLSCYLKNRIFSYDPFLVIDKHSVGKFLINSINRIRNLNSSIEIGICGEHTGELNSLLILKKINFDYISCSLWKIPIIKVFFSKHILLL